MTARDNTATASVPASTHDEHRMVLRSHRLGPLIAFGCVMLLFLCWSFPAHGTGFRILQQGAAATGQSGAFIAQADDPSAIYYNPAGMTQLKGIQTYLGMNLLGGSTSFAGPSGTARGNFGSSVAWPPPSQIYLTANMKRLGLENLTAGIGILSPFGTLYRWPENGPFATAVTNAWLEIIDVKPTLAYKLTKDLSIGLGADIYTFFSFVGNGQYEQQAISTGALTPRGQRLEVNGKDTTAGFNVSFLWTAIRSPVNDKPLVNIGFQYRSQATMHLQGEFLSNGALQADAATTLVLPQIITGGIALWPVRDNDREWKLELDVDYTGWKSLRNLDVHLSSGITVATPQDWRSMYTAMVGTEYKWLRLERLPDWEVALRGGYWNSPTPVPDRNFNPALPDADNHSISIGLGLLCKGKGLFAGLVKCGQTEDSKFGFKAIGLDLAYQLWLFEQRTVAGNKHPLADPDVVNGKYQSTYHLGSFSIRMNF